MTANALPGLILGICGALLLPVLIIGGMFSSWRSLARRYPDRQLEEKQVFTRVSGQVLGSQVLFHRRMRISVGEEGIRIAPEMFFLPAIVIPWTALTDCSPGQYYIFPHGIRIQPLHSSAPIFLYDFPSRYGDVPANLQALWKKYSAGGA